MVLKTDNETSSSCSESVTLCQLSDASTSVLSYTGNCPDPCSAGGCPPGYTRDCVGDQQPDPSHCHCCVNFTPILIDLGGNQLHLSDAPGGAILDINGLGAVLRVAWPLDPNDDVFLVLDRNANGALDSGVELFGNTTPLRNGQVAANGYLALAEVDENRDLWVDAADPGFSLLRLWRDNNRNGAAESDELTTLEANGIVRLSTNYRESARRDSHGNRFRFRAKVETRRPPYERFSYDVFLLTRKP